MGLFAAIGAIVSAAVAVTKALAVAGMAIQGLKALGGVLCGLAKALGLMKPEFKPEEMGDKAIQSGYKPEEFDSYSKYVEAVEKFDADPEKSKQISEEDKLKKGIELATGVLVEQFQDAPMQDFCVALGENKDFFSEGKINDLAKLLQEDGQNISGVLGFLNGTEKNEIKLAETANALTKIEKAANPSLSDAQAYRNVMSLRK